MERPQLTLVAVMDQFEVSRSTLRRGISNGRFPGAKQDTAGRWIIPVDDVITAGIKARQTWLTNAAHEQQQLAHTSADASNPLLANELAHLKNELAHERAQAQNLAALLEVEKQHVDSLRTALRMLESNSVTLTSPIPPPSKRHWFARRR